MKREEVIDVIENGRWWNYLSQDNSKDVYDAVMELHKALDFVISDLREQEKRRWIPASEPPKDSDHVLVCTKHRKPFKARYYPDRKRWDVSGSVVITHWMPLPEPPKEDAR